ncbi:MAG: hypothetical protein ACR2MG_09735 [Pyrinomonadaceae bacterium]
MKEDYLWDKTGGNPEIEKLENALAVFRYQETTPPAPPAKVLPFKEKTPRKMFRLAWAFAACAAFVIVSAGVWFQFSSGKIGVVKDSAETVAPQIDKKISDETLIDKQDDLIVKKVETTKQSAGRKFIKIRKVIPPIARRNKLTAGNIEVKKPTVKLTKDEKYAYDQLMLALSITSSKLKLVKDKVQGVEEQNAVLENRR